MTDQPTIAPTKAPRKSHTPAERAAEAVNVLQRRLAKLTKSKAAFELQALELEPQIEAMQKRLAYALSNPDRSPADVVVGPIDIPEIRKIPAPLPAPAQEPVEPLGLSSDGSTPSVV